MSHCPNGFKGRHQERIEGTPHSAMTWYVCSTCGARRPRGPGLFYSLKGT